MSKRWFSAAFAAAMLLGGVGPASGQAGSTTETIIFVRHAEKPEQGPAMGQLTCQGLNRALALPAVIRGKFQKLDAIFAPSPAAQKDDDGVLFDYVRPLATIEPTAIAFGLPVDAHIGFEDVEWLRAALATPALRSATVLVGWEHKQIEALARDYVTSHGGDGKKAVPKWEKDDFDSIYIIRIVRTGVSESVTFAPDKEGLDNQPAGCPGPSRP